jgi:hypothetical protein
MGKILIQSGRSEIILLAAILFIKTYNIDGRWKVMEQKK